MKLTEELYICADCHFGHTNIIEYEKRPFCDIDEMKTTLVNNWNRIINKDTKVLILGDFSFYPKEQTIELVKSLNGYKMLIMGNHDLRKSSKYYLDCGLEAVSRYPIYYHGVLFSHEPLNVPETMVNIHGHLHSKSLPSPNHICVSVEKTGYKPINIKTLEYWTRRYDGYKRSDFRIFKEYRSDWYK